MTTQTFEQIYEGMQAEKAAEAKPEPVAEVAEPAEETVEQKEVEGGEVEVKEGEGEEHSEFNEADLDKWPAEIKKALRKKDKRNVKLVQEVKRLTEEMNKITAANQPQRQAQQEAAQNDIDMPREQDYDTYADYREALGLYKAKREYDAKFEAEIQKVQNERQSQAKQQQEAENYQRIEARTRELIKENPKIQGEISALLQENLSEIDSLPEAIQSLLEEAENPVLAFYALAKEDALDGLARLSLTKAAHEIAKAELRGAAMVKNQRSNAPRPMPSAKGLGVGTKDFTKMSDDEFRTFFNKQRT